MVSNNLGFMDHLILSSQEDSALEELRVITIKILITTFCVIGFYQDLMHIKLDLVLRWI